MSTGLDELAALVRLFGSRVRIAPDGSVTIDREPPRRDPDLARECDERMDKENKP